LCEKDATALDPECKKRVVEKQSPEDEQKVEKKYRLKIKFSNDKI